MSRQHHCFHVVVLLILEQKLNLLLLARHLILVQDLVYHSPRFDFVRHELSRARLALLIERRLVVALGPGTGPQLHYHFEFGVESWVLRHLVRV